MAYMEFYDNHNMVAFLQKLTRSEEFHQIVDFLAGSHIWYALTTNPTIYVSLVEQFWQTATVEIDNDREQQITVTVDGHNFAITQASVRRHLQLAYADGISSFPITEIFENLSRIRVTTLETELTQTKKVYGKAITKLVKMVKHLEDKLNSTTARRKARMTNLLQQDVNPTKAPHAEVQSQETFEAELSVLSAATILAKASKERVNTYKRKRRSIDSSIVSTAKGLFSTAKDIQVTDEEIAQKLNEEEKAKAAAREE
ncbi:hypothetical protein Tco_1439547 [Tanacetum coccineum]